MAWTSPVTWVAQALTAALLNEQLRDNMNETAPGKASAAGRIFVADAANSIVERIPIIDREDTSEGTTSASFTDLATVGPAVTVSTGTQALVMIAARLSGNNPGVRATMSYAVSGATTSAANENRSIQTDLRVSGDFYSIGFSAVHTGLTAGSNVFTAKYRNSGGTGSTATFHYRVISVIPF